MALLLSDALEGEALEKMIAKVQDDLQSLRSGTIRGVSEDGGGDEGSEVDTRALESMLSRTEQAMQMIAEKMLQFSQKTVSTLPVVPQHTAENSSSSTHTGHLLHIRDQIRASSGSVSLLSPGQVSQVKHLSHLVSQPTLPLSRQLLARHYHLSSGVGHKGGYLEEREMEPWTPQGIHVGRAGVVLTGSTIHPLSTLPRANRRDALLTPAIIQKKDASRGLLSLLERGLIPPASELVLSPPPVAPHKVHLHATHTHHLPQIADGEHGTPLASIKLDPLYSSNEHLRSVHIAHPLTTTSLQFKPTAPPPLSVQTASYVTPHPSSSALQHPRQMLISTRKFGPVCHVIISNGRIADNTNDFKQFKKEQRNQWNEIMQVLWVVEQLCRDYMVSVCVLDCDRVAKLALNRELNLKISREDILAITTNRADVVKILSTPGRRYKGQNGRVAAADKLRATFLMFRARKVHKIFLHRKQAVAVMSTAWLMFISRCRNRQRLKEARAVQLEAHRQRTSELRRSWQHIQSVKRMVVHLPSLGYPDTVRGTIQDLHREQSLQMGRLCDVQDVNVDVVYVSPVALDEDTLDYYHQLLAIYQEEEEGQEEGAFNQSRSNAIRQRVHIVTPENLAIFRGYHMCLSSLLLYSPRCVARIRRLVAGVPAYIIPGMVCRDDIALADALDLPLLASEPNISALYSSKPGARCLLRDIGLPLLAPYEADIFSEKKLFDCLALLIANNLLVPRWLFKLTHQVKGRGFAYCDVVDHLPCYGQLVKEAQRYGSKWTKAWAQEHALKIISLELPAVLGSHAHTISSNLYPTWADFLQAFVKEGGLIEGTPPSDSVTSVTVDVLIDPTGEVKVLSTLDQISSDMYEVLGGSSPQCCVPHWQLMEAVHAVMAASKERGLLGYLSLDFITFIQPNKMTQTLWCVDFDLGYSNNLALHRMMSHVTGLQLDTHSGVLESTHRGKERRFSVLLPHLHHASLSFIYPAVFFQICRAQHIGYNHKGMCGTLFFRAGEKHADHTSVMCVEESLLQAMEQCCSNLNSINKELSTPNTISNFKVIIQELQDITELMKLNSQSNNDTSIA